MHVRAPSSKSRWFLAALLLSVYGCGNEADRVEPGAATGLDAAPARLLLLVSVDQLRGDMLDRYADHFTGGFRRLLDGGTSFPNTTHDHAGTATAPGHATLATGVYPARHGIVGNDWWDPRAEGGRDVYAVEDLETSILGLPRLPGRSPANLRADGLADWTRAASPEARVVAISRKDRSAVTMAGRGPASVSSHAYWLELDEGHPGFTTSTFYRAELPGWVSDFNQRRMPGIWADTVWMSGVPADAVADARPDPHPAEGDGQHTTFPHHASTEAGTAGGEVGVWLENSPAPDVAVLDLATEAVRELELGAGGGVDLLAIGLSSTDGVGHEYGPFSLEQLDNLLRLDRALGSFLAFLDDEVGPGGWALALSSDHGILELPEARAASGRSGARLEAEMVRAERAAIAGASTDEAIVSALESLPFVADAMSFSELASDTPADSFVTLYRNSYVEGRERARVPGHSVVWRLEEGVLEGVREGGTTHGSPYFYDRWVPLLIFGPGVSGAVDSTRAATVDVAPTLAGLGGIPVPDGLDGGDLLR